MALTTSTGAGILTPEQVSTLLVLPVIERSVAATCTTVVNTDASAFRIPLVTADPTASWVAEGAEITPSDTTISETDVVFKKVAGLSIITRELSEDSSPAAAQVVGDGLARDIARKVDAAFFANTTTNGPAGLGSLTTSVVTSGSAFTVDSLIDALAAAAAVGAEIDTFVVNPTDFVALSKLKQATGSNVPLLQNDPAKPSGRIVLGVPLVLSTVVAAGVAWGIPRNRCYVVIRNDATVETDNSVFFTSDRVAVRATMRVGFGFPHALAVVKLTHT
jgi:HK97 family phage major capsid protein